MPKKTDQPSVLVLVPTLGQRPEFLKSTIESIKAQNYKSADILIVCPARSAKTHKIAKEYGCKTADDPGTGLSAALNVGLDLAKRKYKYLAWIGDDDLLRPSSFETTISALESNAKAAVAYGYCDYIDDTGRVLFTNRTGRFAPWIMTWGPNLVPEPGILFRITALTKAGKFDESNKYSMDLDMLLRLRKIGPFVNTKATLAAFRWHESSTTVSNRKAVLDETEKVKRKYLPNLARFFAPLWEKPVRIATNLASKRVTKLANK